MIDLVLLRRESLGEPQAWLSEHETHAYLSKHVPLPRSELALWEGRLDKPGNLSEYHGQADSAPKYVQTLLKPQKAMQEKSMRQERSSGSVKAGPKHNLQAHVPLWPIPLTILSVITQSLHTCICMFSLSRSSLLQKQFALILNRSLFRLHSVSPRGQYQHS